MDTYLNESGFAKILETPDREVNSSHVRQNQFDFKTNSGLKRNNTVFCTLPENIHFHNDAKLGLYFGWLV